MCAYQVLLNVFAVELERALKERATTRTSSNLNNSTNINSKRKTAVTDEGDEESEEAAAATMALTATREDLFAAAKGVIEKV